MKGSYDWPFLSSLASTQAEVPKGSQPEASKGALYWQMDATLLHLTYRSTIECDRCGGLGHTKADHENDGDPRWDHVYEGPFQLR